MVDHDDLHRLLVASTIGLEQPWDALQRVEVVRRRLRRRRAAAGLSVAVALTALLVTGAVITLSEATPDGRVPMTVLSPPIPTPIPTHASCVRSPDHAVPDCPVDPPSIGTAGEPAYLPEGWELYAEEDTPVPTATDQRVQAHDRRYRRGGDRGPVQGFLHVSVWYGDVSLPVNGPDLPEGTPDSSLRPGTTVLVYPPSGAFSFRYVFMLTPRVRVDVSQVDGGMSDADLRHVVASISS